MTCKDTEIRKVKSDEIYDLALILNDSNAWKKLMAIVRKEGNIPKFNNDHIRMIEQASVSGDKRNPAQIFLDEWSTMGKKRPTLGVLLDLLVTAELFRAADYVACNILKQKKPKRPNTGPAASIDISDAVINDILEKQQMLLPNTFNDPLLLKSEMNEMYFYENMDNNMKNENAKNTSDIIKKSLNCASNNSGEILKDTDNPEMSMHKAQYDGHKEVSTQELPIFVLNNNSEQSATELNDELQSSNIPLCIKNI